MEHICQEFSENSQNTMSFCIVICDSDISSTLADYYVNFFVLNMALFQVYTVVKFSSKNIGTISNFVECGLLFTTNENKGY